MTIVKSLILLSLVYLELVSVCKAADTGSNGFVGCFDVEDLETSSAMEQAMKDAVTCKANCFDQRRSLAIVSIFYDGKRMCGCTNTLPDPALSYSTDVKCAATISLGKAAVYYTMAEAKTCKLELIPFTSKYWNINYESERIRRYDINTAISLGVDSTGKGTGFYLKGADQNFVYGMYQLDAMVSPRAGVVTAFYLRSDYFQETKDFSEIDFEWINDWPASNNTIWTNSYVNGRSNGEEAIEPDVYQVSTRTNALTTPHWNTYTIDWQPRYLSWSFNNQPIRRMVKGETYTTKDAGSNWLYYDKVLDKTPDKPCHVHFTTWSCLDQSCRNGQGGQFGGNLDTSGPFPYFSHFKNLKRLTCS